MPFGAGWFTYLSGCARPLWDVDCSASSFCIYKGKSSFLIRMNLKHLPNGIFDGFPFILIPIIRQQEREPSVDPVRGCIPRGDVPVAG